MYRNNLLERRYKRRYNQSVLKQAKETVEEGRRGEPSSSSAQEGCWEFSCAEEPLQLFATAFIVSQLYVPDVAVGILLPLLFFKGDAAIHETVECWNNEILQKSLLFQTGWSESTTDLTGRACSKVRPPACTFGMPHCHKHSVCSCLFLPDYFF